MLNKLQKRACRTGYPTVAAPLEPFGHGRNVASLGLFYSYKFGRCLSELAELVPLLFSHGRTTRYSDKLYDFSVTFFRCKDIYVISFFPCLAM